MIIAVVIGTRPELIKLAPLITRLQSESVQVTTVFSGQHRHLLDPLVEWFQIRPDHNLDLMIESQSLSGVVGAMIDRLGTLFDALKPDLVVAQGDTSTVFSAGVVAFMKSIKFAHIEAGLRSNDLSRPFPEEYYRRVVSLGSCYHFCPTQNNANTLIREGLNIEGIHVVGNTVIDALFATVSKLREMGTLEAEQGHGRDKLLLTMHRRESFGEPMAEAFAAINAITERYPNLDIHFPVHPNPQVRVAAKRAFSGNPAVMLLEPLDYPDLVRLMWESQFILTDSGGIQEEAPAIGKPVIVLRTETERNEMIENGAGILVGTSSDKIMASVSKLMEEPGFYQQMASAGCPYGDGFASKRIVDILLH